MLVVSRKPGESIIIGGDIRVTVVEIYRNQTIKVSTQIGQRLAQTMVIQRLEAVGFPVHIWVQFIEATSLTVAKLGITAPNDVKIDREEIHAAKAANGGVTF